MLRKVLLTKVLAVILAAGLVTALPATSVLAAAKSKDAPAAATGGRAAALERQRKCGAEWKEAKAAGKIEKGKTWPKYWSECNKRLKAAGT